MLSRRRFIQGACAALGLVTPAADLLKRIAQEDPSDWLREAAALEWLEGTEYYGKIWWITARSGQGAEQVTAPPMKMHVGEMTVADFDAKMFAKRAIVQWFREGGAERTLSHARARESRDIARV